MSDYENWQGQFANSESKLTDCVENGLLGLRGGRAFWSLGELQEGPSNKAAAGTISGTNNRQSQNGMCVEVCSQAAFGHAVIDRMGETQDRD
jgi:hypothetical protein